MNWFNKIHGRKTPRGLEAKVLLLLPRITLFGVLGVSSLSVIVRLWPVAQGVDAAKHIQSVEIFAIAIGITFLTAVFTVAIGAFVVHVMKGPAYVADAYPVSHADEPEDS